MCKKNTGRIANERKPVSEYKVLADGRANRVSFSPALKMGVDSLVTPILFGCSYHIVESVHFPIFPLAKL